ncbi:MAG: P1 family peptidase [Alphaproteobacteria bacterium]|nr:P1 family peptidase [Alphaproteobacteria bacterium]
MHDATLFTPSGKLRAAGLGLTFEGKTGVNNSITDVEGVSVGYATIIAGHGALKVGSGPVRTGVTALLPRPIGDLCCPVFAGCFSLNGNGELTGSHYVEEVGKFALPMTITNTHSCGTTRDATIRWAVRRFAETFRESFALPVAAETYDGFLNDINGFHVTEEHVFQAIQSATSGPIEEGSVGGGTGMKCFGFKAGSGTASRRVDFDGSWFTVGAFVQANFGGRADLTILGHRVGTELREPRMIRHTPDPELSSIIGVIATDAPLLPHQLKRIARRAALGMGRVGGIARHGSGDIFIAFSTANAEVLKTEAPVIVNADLIPDEHLDGFFEATVRSTEEAILNSLVANDGMEGRDGNFVPALPHDVIRALVDARG